MFGARVPKIHLCVILLHSKGVREEGERGGKLANIVTLGDNSRARCVKSQLYRATNIVEHPCINVTLASLKLHRALYASYLPRYFPVVFFINRSFLYFRESNMFYK